MYLVILLVLIPFISVGLVMYISMLYQFIITTSINSLLLIIGLFILMLGSYFLLNTIFKLIKRNCKILNINMHKDSLYGFICFTFLMLLGLSMIINSIVNSINGSLLTMGTIIIIFYIYIIYIYFFDKKEIVFELNDIDKIDKSIYKLSFVNNTEFVDYYVNNGKYDVGSKYKCLYNKHLKSIMEIKNEVKDLV